MQIERRVFNTEGQSCAVDSRGQGIAGNEPYIPDGCPPEFRAKIRLIAVGRADVAALEFEQREAEFRANAVERLRETAADLL